MISFWLITWWTLFLPPYEIFYWSFKPVFADFYEWFHDGFMLYFADVCFFFASFILWWIWLNCWICFFPKKKIKKNKSELFLMCFVYTFLTPPFLKQVCFAGFQTPRTFTKDTNAAILYARRQSTRTYRTGSSNVANVGFISNTSAVCSNDVSASDVFDFCMKSQTEIKHQGREGVKCP